MVVCKLSIDSIGKRFPMMQLFSRHRGLLLPLLAITHLQSAATIAVSAPVPEATTQLSSSIPPSGNQTNGLFEQSIEAGFAKLKPYTSARQVWAIDGRGNDSPIPGPANFRVLTLTAYDPRQQKLFVTKTGAMAPFDWSAPTAHELPPVSNVHAWQWDSIEMNLRGALLTMTQAGYPGPFRYVRYLWPKRDPFSGSLRSELFIGFSPDSNARNVPWYLVGTKSSRTGISYRFGGRDIASMEIPDMDAYPSS